MRKMCSKGGKLTIKFDSNFILRMEEISIFENLEDCLYPSSNMSKNKGHIKINMHQTNHRLSQCKSFRT